MHTSPTRTDRLRSARLYLLIHGCSSADALEQLARSLIGAGADVLQLRDKQLSDRNLLIRARRLRRITHETHTLFIMNDRPDLALASQADGVHVGQDELPAADVRALVGPELLLGVSTHSLEQARQAEADGADYLGCGPVFPSTTKHFSAFPGLELLRRVSRDIRLPVFAIGGISANNLDQVLAAGARRVAVSGAVLNAADPAEAVRQLRRRFDPRLDRSVTEAPETRST